MFYPSPKKIVAALLLGTIVVPSFLFSGAQTALALNLSTASSSVISAGIGCAASNLIQRKLSGKISTAIGGEAAKAAGGVGSVTVKDPGTNEATESLANKENCLKKIARAASQVVLREMTKQTVAWINTGFDGKPLFVRNPASFFKSLKDREISGLAKTFNDKNKYPYGQAFIRGYVNSIQTGLERNAQYSLNESLGGYSAKQYNQNFNLGGWNAWRAQSLPQNNPVGFSLMASQELSKRIKGTDQSIAQDLRDELQQGMGFLSQKVCVDRGTTSTGSITPSGQDIVDLENGLPSDETIPVSAEVLPGSTPNNECKRYETTTPGGVISNQLVNALQIPQQSLLLAPEDLDASLQAVFDALLNQLFKKGLASLTDNVNGSSAGSGVNIASSGGYGNNASTVATTSTTQSNENAQWFDQNPQFDITNVADIQAIIDTQNVYLQAVSNGYAAPPNSTVGPSNSAATIGFQPLPASPLGPINYAISGLTPTSTYPLPQNLRTLPLGQNYWLSVIIPEIYQLDYCIPGPHPGWENETQGKLAALESKIKDVNSYTDGHALAQVYDSVTLGIPHALINFLTNLTHPGDLNADDYARIKVYAAEIGKITGIPAKLNGFIGTREKVITILDTLLERLTAVMNEIFSPANLPAVAGEAASLFGKINGYESILNTNNQDILTLQGIVRRLDDLKIQITALNAEQATLDAQITNQTITPAAAQTAQADISNRLDFIKRSFSSFAQSFVTQADIQGIHDQTQELIGDIVYIHNTLIKGASGCEAQVPFAPLKSRVRSFPYPAPHLYDYPQDSSGAGVVDLNSLGIDSMPDPLANGLTRVFGTYYPFLEYAYFGIPYGANLSPYTGWSDIHITDASDSKLIDFDPQEVSPTVGIFEAQIGPLW